MPENFALATASVVIGTGCQGKLSLVSGESVNEFVSGENWTAISGKIRGLN